MARGALILLLALWPVPTSAQGRVFVASEWAVLVGHSLDAASTQRCLGAGRCREANPWLARYDNPVAFTAAKSGLAVVQLWTMRRLHKSHPRLATVTNFAMGAAFTSIAIRNARVGGL